ncbi:MAG: DegT/DnrJ/EryC1/StrS family aminotransferase [Synoicihabitans sp.]
MSDTPSTPIVDEPFPLPQRWGTAEVERLTEAMQQSSLFYWQGPQTTALYEAFREVYPLKHLFPCSSGTASIHLAVAAMKFKPGEEVIVPAITDMGSVLGILHQLLVPVFADIEPRTYNVDPASVRAAITPKTRAILAVHLCGNPCNLAALREIATEHNLVLIEDCAQAWGAKFNGTYVGLWGDLACYSFNDYKHLSCGDGGMVGTQHDDVGLHLGKWGDKCYNRVTGVRNPDELAYNYRMSEPLSAICTAQMGKHDAIVEQRTAIGMRLSAALQDVAGILSPAIRAEDTHTFYNYIFRLDLTQLSCTRDNFTAALRDEGMRADGYLPDPVYRYDLFQHHNFFADTWPIRELGLTDMDYTQVVCPESEKFLSDCVHLPFNEAMTASYIDKVALAIRTVAQRFRKPST